MGNPSLDPLPNPSILTKTSNPRLVILYLSESQEIEVFSDVPIDARQLDEIAQKDRGLYGDDDLMIEIDGKWYAWDKIENEERIRLDKGLVENVFQKIKSKSKETKIRDLSLEIQEKRKMINEYEAEINRLLIEFKKIESMDGKDF